MAWQQHKCTMAFSMQQSFCFIRPPSNHQHRRRQPNKQPPARASLRTPCRRSPWPARPCPRGRATRAVQAAVSANSNNGSELFIRAKNNTIQDTKLPRCKFSLQLISRSLGIRSVQCLILIFVVKSREGKFFEVEMTVARDDCELDKYGVVTSAVLAAYMETGQLVAYYHRATVTYGMTITLCRVA